MTGPAANPFWRWSLDHYGGDGVETALLRLQDSYGLDVNLLLWCCWRASCGEALSQDALRAGEQAIADWTDNIVRPLRAVRRRLKTEGPPGLRETVKQAELAAESHVQDILFARSAEPLKPRPPGDAEKLAFANLIQYASLEGGAALPAIKQNMLQELAHLIFAQPGNRAGRAQQHQSTGEDS